jgi:hypothetical protein
VAPKVHEQDCPGVNHDTSCRQRAHDPDLNRAGTVHAGAQAIARREELPDEVRSEEPDPARANGESCLTRRRDDNAVGPSGTKSCAHELP